MKIKTADGKTKTFNLKDAAIDPSVKVEAPSRSLSRGTSAGRARLTVAPDQAKQ